MARATSEAAKLEAAVAVERGGGWRTPAPGHPRAAGTPGRLPPTYSDAMERAPAGKQALEPPEEVGRASWTWHDGPTEGAAVVFDLDGVLSNAAARQHFIKAPRPDWESFFSASADDPLVDEVAALLGLLAPGWPSCC